jgi:hypothetical protein
MAMFCEPNLKNRDINEAIRKSVGILPLARQKERGEAIRGG